MRERISAWINPISQDPDLARREFMLNVVLLGLVGLDSLFTVGATVLWLVGRPDVFAGAVAGIAILPFYFWAYWLNRRGRTRLAVYFPVIGLFLVMTGATFQVGIGHSTLVGYAMVVSLAGLLLGARPALLFVFLLTVFYVVAGVRQTSGQLPMAVSPETTVIVDSIAIGLGLSGLLVFEWLSNQQFVQALRKEQQLTEELDAHRAQLEQRVAERTTELERRAVQLEVAAEIARATTSVLNLDTLLNQAVTLIRQRFDLYYVGLFLLDETRLWAELRAGTGAVGGLMLEQGHRLGVGGNSMVGWCTLHAQPSVSLDVGKEIVRFDNPLLPDTRSEAALPLIARGRVIGALDVQSVAEAAFPEESVAILQTLAGQIAVAIDNARLLDEVQASLAEAHAVHRQYLREAWAGFAAARAPAAGFRYVAGSVEPDPEVWLPAMTDAQRQNRVVIAPDEDGVDTLSLPIVLRGETIGVLGFKKDGGGEWTDDDVAVAQAVADQVALSLENVRLFDEAQRRARREGLMRELADKMRRTADANTILETAVQGLGRALGSARAFVRLGVPSAE